MREQRSGEIGAGRKMSGGAGRLGKLGGGEGVQVWVALIQGRQWRARPVVQPGAFNAGDCGCAATCGRPGAGNVESASNEAAKPARTAAAAWVRWECGGSRHGVVQAAACGRVAEPACHACVA
jgi:hypothetical protein